MKEQEKYSRQKGKKPVDLTRVYVSIYTSVLNIPSHAWFVSLCFTPTGNRRQNEMQLICISEQARQVKTFLYMCENVM